MRTDIMETETLPAVGKLNEYQLNNTPITSDVLNPFSKPATALPTEFQMKKVLLFYNPSSGKGYGNRVLAEIVLPLFNQHGIKTIVRPTKCKNDLLEYLVREKQDILLDELDAFVVVGGGGTFYDFINGYVCGKYKQDNIPVILVNGGTGNAMMATLNGFTQNDKKLTLYLQHILANIEGNKNIIQWCDCIECINQNGQVQYASSMSYFGISSAGMNLADKKVFRMSGSFKYDLASMTQLCKARNYKVKLTMSGVIKKGNCGENVDQKYDDEEPVELIRNVEMVMPMKGKYFGKGICVAPYAKLDNGYLDVVVIEKPKHRLTALKWFAKLKRIPKKNSHNLFNGKSKHYYRCKELKIEAVDQDNNTIDNPQILKLIKYPDVGVDGERGFDLPVTIKAVEHSLPLIFPKCKLFYSLAFPKRS
eukprot:32616_1